MPRHKKPVELKKLEGTYRADRDEKTLAVSTIVPSVTEIKCPSEIKCKYCRTAFDTHAKFLQSLGLLQQSDMPQLTSLYVLLQEVRKVAASLEQMEVTNAAYEKLATLYIRLTDRFDKLASVYYISPAARTKLTSDMIQIQKGKLETESITERMLKRKKA